MISHSDGAETGTLTVRVTEPENIEGGIDCSSELRSRDVYEVPQGSKEKYESVQAWADFAPNIEELESTGIEHINRNTVIHSKQSHTT